MDRAMEQDNQAKDPTPEEARRLFIERVSSGEAVTEGAEDSLAFFKANPELVQFASPEIQSELKKSPK
jgi:hypothetical protein